MFCYTQYCSAGVAHLVERHLAKVEVAGSSPVARSRNFTPAFWGWCDFFVFPEDEELFVLQPFGGYAPRTPGYFPHAGKVTKGALRKGTLSIVSNLERPH